MFVLFTLIQTGLRSVIALWLGMSELNRPQVPATRAKLAINSIANPQMHPLAPLHAPNSRRTV